MQSTISLSVFFATLKELRVWILVGAILGGIGGWMVSKNMKKSYESEIILETSRDDYLTLKDTLKIKDAMVNIFSQMQLSTLFAQEFFKSLSEKKEGENTPEAFAVYNYLEKVASDIDTSANKVDKKSSAIRGLSYYLRSTMVQFLRTTSPLPKSGFLFFINPNDAFDWKFTLRTAIPDASLYSTPGVVEAFNKVVNIYNEQQIKIRNNSNFIKKQELVNNYDQIAKDWVPIKSNYEIEKSSIDLNIFKLEAEVAKESKDRKENNLTTSSNSTPNFILSSPSLSGADMVEILDSVGRNARMVNIAKEILLGNHTEETIKKIAEIDAEKTKLANKFEASLRTISTAKKILGDELIKISQPLKIEEFALSKLEPIPYDGIKYQVEGKIDQTRNFDFFLSAFGSLAGIAVGLFLSRAFRRKISGMISIPN